MCISCNVVTHMLRWYRRYRKASTFSGSWFQLLLCFYLSYVLDISQFWRVSALMNLLKAKCWHKGAVLLCNFFVNVDKGNANEIHPEINQLTLRMKRPIIPLLMLESRDAKPTPTATPPLLFLLFAVGNFGGGRRKCFLRDVTLFIDNSL